MGRVLVTGATGFVGKKLVSKLIEKGFQVNVVSRSKSKAEKIFGNKVNSFEWSPTESPLPASAAKDVSHVINLMGENIGEGRWSEERKKRIHDSRVTGTQNLIRGLKDAGIELESFVSTSAIGYYPINRPEALDENTQNDNSTYLGKICEEWEKATEGAPCKRKVIVRVGVVLEKESGALAKLYPIFLLGGGGKAGSGKQMMSWIHRDDLVNIYVNSIENDQYTGAINATAPNPVDNLTFSKALAKSLSRPCLFPAPGFALKLALGEMSTIVLDGQNVVPKKLQELGFNFQYENVQDAMNAIF